MTIPMPAQVILELSNANVSGRALQVAADIGIADCLDDQPRTSRPPCQLTQARSAGFSGYSKNTASSAATPRAGGSTAKRPASCGRTTRSHCAPSLA